MGAPGPALTGRPPGAVVRSAVAEALADLDPGQRVLVALSGGPDSLALLAATVRVGADQGLLCGAVVVDHGLQDGSDMIAATAVDQARLLGCDDVRALRVQVAEGPGSGGPEGAARSARYAALAAAGLPSEGRQAAAAVLLGHTLEDQAETVLLGVARGSGLRSLAGMPARSGVYRRPLLAVPRAVVRAAADEQARQDARLSPWSDPHNLDDRFARSRVRGALPELEAALGPGIVAGLARTAALAREDADALDDWAQAVWQQLRADGAIRLPGGLESTGWNASSSDRPADSPEPHAASIGPGRSAPSSASSTPERAVGVAELDASALATGARRPAPGSDQVLPGAIRSRVVRRFLLEAGCRPGDLTATQVRAVLALVDGPARSRAEIALAGGRRARREGAVVSVRV